jgi:serine phosphatase RsbU (regulator of sigma subunit)/PAS domain-containing protein
LRTSRGNPVAGSAPTRRHDWTAQVRRLESEVAGLRRSMRTRGLIEQAKGILAERLGIDPEAAFGHLAKVSQNTNIRLIDVAADTVGCPRPELPRPELPRPELPRPEFAGPVAEAPAAMSRVVRRRPLAAAAEAVPPPTALPTPFARALRRFTTAANAAQTPTELAEAVATEAVGWLQAAAVAIFGLEPSGAVRLLGASGWSPRVIADWQLTPSAVPTPASHVARLDCPLWIDGSEHHAYTVIGGGRRRAVLPLRLGDAGSGALEVAWSHPAPFPDTECEYLNTVASAVGRRLAVLLIAAATEDAPPAGGRWLEATLDALPVAALLLTPIREPSTELSDFRIDYANPVALAHYGVQAGITGDGRSIVGRRLLDADPDLVTGGVFDAYAQAYDQDRPVQLEPAREVASNGRSGVVRRGATRIGSRLVVTWESAASEDGGGEQSSRMEILGHFGWGEWSNTLEPLAWSTGLFRLLGRDPARGPQGLSRLLARVVAEDVPAAEAMVRQVLREGQEASAEIRLERSGETRTVRVVAEPRLDHRKQPVAMLALLQDVTDDRRRDSELSRTGEQLAAQRLRIATEQVYIDELRRILYPPTEDRYTDANVRICARHRAPKSMHRFRGDFYDIITVADGVVLTVGDVFGSGVNAATTMVRLRHATRALCLAGHDPAEVLSLLNRELHRDADPPLASLVVARFRSGEASMLWAQAGHFAPAHLRAGRTRSLNRPPGVALGLTLDAVYEPAELALRGGDLLVFYTDGVLGSLDGEGDPVSHLMRGFGTAHREGGSNLILDRYLQPAETEACVVTTEIAL